MKKRAALIAVLVLLIAGVGGVWWWKHRQAPTFNAGARPQQRSNATVKVDVPTAPLQVGVVVNVADAGALYKVAKDNAWLQDALKTPLGKGFVGAWAGFFESTGEDLQASFRGTLLDYFLGQVVQPVSVLWFAGSNAPGTPAIVIDQPARPLRDAVAAIAKAAEWGELTASHCPGEAPPSDENAVKFTLGRWLVAEQTMFVYRSDTRIVLASKALAAIAGACAKITPVKSDGVTVTLVPAALGREAVALATLLGIDGSPSLQLDAKNGTLSPRGIAGALKTNHLSLSPLPDEAFHLIPEVTPVVLSLSLMLPSELSDDKLKEYLGGGGSNLVERRVSLLWWPSNTSVGDLAILWSKVQDAPALKHIFAGPNHLRSENLCGQHVLASSSALLDQLHETCKGSASHPSLQNAAPAVVNGWKAPSSMTLAVNFGHLFRALMLLSYGKAAPAEINAAAEQLGALPIFGFTGNADGKALQPVGFHS